MSLDIAAWARRLHDDGNFLSGVSVRALSLPRLVVVLVGRRSVWDRSVSAGGRYYTIPQINEGT